MLNEPPELKEWSIRSGIRIPQFEKREDRAMMQLTSLSELEIQRMRHEMNMQMFCEYFFSSNSNQYTD